MVQQQMKQMHLSIGSRIPSLPQTFINGDQMYRLSKGEEDPDYGEQVQKLPRDRIVSKCSLSDKCLQLYKDGKGAFLAIH